MSADFVEMTGDFVKRPKKGDLRVWHIPQVPGIGMVFLVKDPTEAKRLMNVLAQYDLFQFNHNIKPDYSNASGLDEYDGREWLTWYSEDGDDIDEWEVPQ